ncbi:type IV toxin-antitoxin system AbiEi family antitoxin [Photobacterium swingsii]|uniref:type IV toxin-antitoxin system AbiEi family antitoxin n=1 Tax=Photobacterium swingsii TaxID=680026 RepID=UPI004067BE60
MKVDAAISKLDEFDNKGFYVFHKRDLRRLFFKDTDTAFKQSVVRLVKRGILERPAKSVYVYARSKHKGYRTIEKIASVLRKYEYNYISLESALSEYGAISQIPIDRLTVMTTGRKGTFKTSYGIIEFTHTKRTAISIIDNTVKTDHPLRMATLEAAFRDLKRVGRNIDMVDRHAFGI